jgi:hypothetical protein
LLVEAVMKLGISELLNKLIAQEGERARAREVLEHAKLMLWDRSWHHAGDNDALLLVKDAIIRVLADLE